MGDLYLEDVPLQDIASKYGTPTYVYSEREEKYTAASNKPWVVCRTHPLRCKQTQI